MNSQTSSSCPGVQGSAGAAGGCRLRACRRAPGGVERRAHVRATREPTLRWLNRWPATPDAFVLAHRKVPVGCVVLAGQRAGARSPGRCGEPAGPLGHHGPEGLGVRRCPPAVCQPGWRRGWDAHTWPPSAAPSATTSVALGGFGALWHRCWCRCVEGKAGGAGLTVRPWMNQAALVCSWRSRRADSGRRTGALAWTRELPQP